MDEPLLKDHLAKARLRRDLPPPEGRRYLRRRLGLTQQQVADVLGVNRVTVARWEAGSRSPSSELLSEYLQLLGLLEQSR